MTAWCEHLARKHRQTGSVRALQRQPRHRVTTKAQDRHIRVLLLRNRLISATETAGTSVGNHGRPISPPTVCSRLREIEIPARRHSVKAVLTRRHRQTRLEGARAHLRFTRADWANVLIRRVTSLVVMTAVSGCKDVRTNAFLTIVSLKGIGGGSVMILAGPS